VNIHDWSILFGEIAGASNEQAKGVAQISTGLEQIDQVTQANTANAEESAAASEELSGQSNQLKQMILRFNLKNDGRAMQSAQQPVNAVASLAPVKQTKKRTKKKASKNVEQEMNENVDPEDVIVLDDDQFGKF